jgi:hypothetical protein
MVDLARIDSTFQIIYSNRICKNRCNTPRDWRMYNEGNDSGYNDGYNQGHLAGHGNDWNEAKEDDLRLFERGRNEVKQQSKEEGTNNDYSEEMEEQYEESD